MQERTVDRIFFGVFVFGLVSLGFLAGSFVTALDVRYRNLLDSATLWLSGGPAAATPKATVEAADWQKAVTRHAPDEAFIGYTFFSSGHAQGALLVDMDGRVVHQWTLRFRDAFPGHPHVRNPKPETEIHWRHAHLFRDGRVIAVYEGLKDRLWGYGMVEVDAKSNVVWTYADRAHHHFDVAPDGRIFAIVHSSRDDATFEHFGKGVIEDFVVELTAKGRETRRVSILDALVESPFRDTLLMLSGAEWDVTHANAVKWIDPVVAARYPFAKAGQVLLSLRTIDALVVLDLDDERIVWASRGFWKQQHDPDFLPNGNIMLFDNQGHAAPGGGSRVIEFDPMTNAMTWVYAGTTDKPLYSIWRSSQMVLPNDNVLITESLPNDSSGRILEVTRDGRVVWELKTPANGGMPGLLTSAVRYPPGELAFLR